MDFGDSITALNDAVDTALSTSEEQAAVHTPAVGAEQTALVVIVQQPFEAEASDRGTKLTVSVTRSRFVTAPLRGDGISIGDVDYLIANINADDGGRLDLTLEKV